ncbi:MAG: hypothetical protein Q8M02_13295 [Candidatus Didemnitutus sp.]|nr:hypothetical protein [Candidatus Didemnitutus sp.]
MFTSLKSDPATVLLWGDRWWLPRHKLPVPFTEPGQAAAHLAAAWPGQPGRLRLIYQPDDLVTVPAECPHAERAALAIVLAEEHPALAHPGLLWSHEPILRSGDTFSTLLHHETRPALFGLVHELQEHGFTVESVWPMPTWLNALPPDLSDSGAMTLVAMSAERFCLYRHSAEGVRSVQSGQGADAPERLAEILCAMLAQSPDEFVLYVTTDDALLETLNQRQPVVGNRVVGHFSVWEALAKSAVIPARHPAQMLPAAAALWPARLMRATSALMIVAGLALAGDYVRQHVAAQHAEREASQEIAALRSELEQRRDEVSGLAAREAEAGASTPWCADWLRTVQQLPAGVTLTALQASPQSFVLKGGVTAGPINDVRWRAWLTRFEQAAWQIEAGTPTGGVQVKGNRP